MVNEVCAEPSPTWSVAHDAPRTEEDAMSTPGRPENRETENENQRRPAQDGTPPRPATEPGGAEGSSNSGETATDPATGKPND